MWVCNKCFHNNDRKDTVCASCGAARLVNNRAENPVRGTPSCQKCNLPIHPTIGHCLKCKKAELKSLVGPVPRDYTEKDTKEDLRLVLIGKTGNGKSATANTIIGTEAFTSKASSLSVTKTSKHSYAERFGRVVGLVDTPGLFDTNLKKDVVEIEIKKSIGMSSPGPHAFLFVTSFARRFTQEEEKVIQEIDSMFGEGMTRHMIVVFTCRDQLDSATESEYLSEAPKCLQQLIKSAGGGSLSFNNKGNDEEKERDVKNLFSRIDQMIATNKGPFSSTLYQQGEGLMKDAISRRRREEYGKITEVAVQERLKEDVEEKMKMEKEYCQKLLKAAPETAEAMKKDKEAIKKKSRQTDATVENMLADVLENLAEILVKTDETKNQIENAKGAKRMTMGFELASGEKNIEEIKAEREKAEDRVKRERLIYTETLIAQGIREQERDKIQNGDIRALRALLAAVKIKPHFLRLFQEN
ncbi:GTPase IMAP family member 9-like [Haliotis asinina]|uniref:GTPase IMAP family member 9-like n=1 Tax=Haliotis asinina TaxID=109174 RepID=UPI003531D6D1